MNYINCQNTVSPTEIIKTIAFWAENTLQHIQSLINSYKGTTAVLREEFRVELERLLNSFKNIYSLYSNEQNTRLSLKPDIFFKENMNFINLLERLKFEGYNGYPDLQQTIFHYLYEQRYVNAIFAVNGNNSNLLITTRFAGMGNYPYICVYNQIYFWSIIGAMHPALLAAVNAFYDATSTYTKEFLTDTTNRFNEVNFALSTLKRPITKPELLKVFEVFEKLNSKFLSFLMLIKQNSPKIYTNPYDTRLPQSFYGTVQHMINEHTLVSEINKGISEKLL